MCSPYTFFNFSLQVCLDCRRRTPSKAHANIVYINISDSLKLHTLTWLIISIGLAAKWSLKVHAIWQIICTEPILQNVQNEFTNLCGDIPFSIPLLKYL